jgi:sterol desaturase/sphingolipid hydroxylase (fatty acid hydroxylase superfamily)
MLLMSNHLVMNWVWMIARMIEAIDTHLGYDLPYNPLHLIPGYAGVRAHDHHHKSFNANFSSTFTWWDKYCGTNTK